MKKLLLLLLLIGCTARSVGFRQINTGEYLELRQMVKEYPEELREIYHEYHLNDHVIDILEFRSIKQKYNSIKESE